MKPAPFMLRLRLSQDDSFTQLRLRGSVVTAPPACEVEQLLTLLSRWTGSPVELVLSVDCGSVAWFESWGDATSEVPARHLQVRFMPDGHRHRRGGRDAAR
jgi:hypothetical protein